jgi:hypothetical protein
VGQNNSQSPPKNNPRPCDLIIYGKIDQNVMSVLKSMAYAIIPIFVIALTLVFTITPNTFNAYAITGHTNGYGAYSGHSPLLGVDNKGQTLIEDGLRINGQVFKVQYFTQEIQTQTFKVNQPIDITLHLYLKGGAKSLGHTSLIINNGESKHIDWDQDIKGTQTIFVSDDEFFKDVTTKLSEDPNNPYAAFLNFKFKISEKTETSTLKIVTWNLGRNSWTNYFENAIKVDEPILATNSQTPDMNEIKSPLKQTRDGVTASNVKCDLGKKLMIKNNGTPICVSPASASKLVAMGWVKQA